MRERDRLCLCGRGRGWMSTEWWKGWVELTPFLSATYCAATAAIKLTTSFQITIDTIWWTIIHTHWSKPMIRFWRLHCETQVNIELFLLLNKQYQHLLMKRNNNIIFVFSISIEWLCPNKYSNNVYQNMV